MAQERYTSATADRDRFWIDQEPAMYNYVVADRAQEDRVVSGPMKTRAEALAFIAGVEWTRDRYDLGLEDEDR